MARRERATSPRARKAATASEPRPGDPGNPSPETEMPEISVSQPAKRSPGRPPGRKPIAARYTIRLDEARHEALQRIADERGRSLHSLVLEAIDDLLRKPGGVGLS